MKFINILVQVNLSLLGVETAICAALKIEIQIRYDFLYGAAYNTYIQSDVIYYKVSLRNTYSGIAS